MYRENRIALVIPARNEERLIRPTLENVPAYFDRVYVVDDGSSDRTADVVRELAARDPRVELLGHERNQGVGQAIITGYQLALREGCDIAVVCGGDFQMPLDESPRLMDPIVDGDSDYVKGNRFMERGNAFDIMPRTRLIGNTLLSLMTKVASGNYGVFDVVDGFTAISRKAMESVDWGKAWKGYGYPMDFIIRISSQGFRIKDVPRRAIYLPGERQSQIKGFRYMVRVTPMIGRAFMHRLVYQCIYYDFHPLVLLYFAGIALFPLGLLSGLYLVINKLLLGGAGVTGSRSVLCAILVISGAQFILSAMAMDQQAYAMREAARQREPRTPILPARREETKK